MIFRQLCTITRNIVQPTLGWGSTLCHCQAEYKQETGRGLSKACVTQRLLVPHEFATFLGECTSVRMLIFKRMPNFQTAWIRENHRSPMDERAVCDATRAHSLVTYIYINNNIIYAYASNNHIYIYIIFSLQVMANSMILAPFLSDSFQIHQWKHACRHRD